MSLNSSPDNYQSSSQTSLSNIDSLSRRAGVSTNDEAYYYALNQDDSVKQLCSLSFDDAKYLETFNSVLSIFEAVVI